MVSTETRDVVSSAGGRDEDSDVEIDLESVEEGDQLNSSDDKTEGKILRKNKRNATLREPNGLFTPSKSEKQQRNVSLFHSVNGPSKAMCWLCFHFIVPAKLFYSCQKFCKI